MKSPHQHADLQLQQNKKLYIVIAYSFAIDFFGGTFLFGLKTTTTTQQTKHRQTIYMSLNFNYVILVCKLITVVLTRCILKAVESIFTIQVYVAACNRSLLHFSHAFTHASSTFTNKMGAHDKKPWQLLYLTGFNNNNNNNYVFIVLMTR